MKMSLHIERLVLEGIPISAAQRAHFQAALETELTQLLRNGGLSDELRAGAALAQVQSGAIRIGKDSSPEKLATDIATAVHQGLGPSNKRPSPPPEHRLPAEHRRASPRGNPR